MDKNFLIRVNNSLKRIKTQLLLNEKIRTLLYFDSIGDNTVAPPIEIAAQHVFVQPIVDVDVSEPFNKRNYITITVPEGEIDDNAAEYIVRIIVMCDKSSWNIEGDIRPLLLSQLVVNELEGFKTEFSNTLKLTNIVETVTNKDVCGYSLLFGVFDGIRDNNDK